MCSCTEYYHWTDLKRTLSMFVCPDNCQLFVVYYRVLLIRKYLSNNVRMVYLHTQQQQGYKA